MKRPITSAAARRQLGNLPRTSFWRLVRERNVPCVWLNRRTARFEQAVIDALERHLTITTPAEQARLTDRRYTAYQGAPRC